MALPRAATSGATALVALSLITAPVLAQEHTAPVPAVDEHQTAHGAAEGHDAHGEEHPRNALGIVLGGTYESEENDTFFTIGAEYERVLSPKFAVALGLEHITEVDAWVAVVPFVYRHGSGWRILTGPGLELKTRRPEREREHEGGPGIAGEIVDGPPEKEENLFLWRFGVGYNFEVGERYAIAPHVDLDLVREDGHWVEAVVFTVSIGFDF